MSQSQSSSADSQIYRHIVQSLRDCAVSTLDPTGVILIRQPQAERLDGYAAEEIVGRHVSVLYTPEDRAAGTPERALAQASEAGHAEAEGWRLHRDGSRFWARVALDRICDDSGAAIGFVEIARDQSGQRAAQEQALDEERRFRHLVQGVNDYALYMLDLDGNVSNWNPGAQRAKGYTAAEVVGRHVSLFYTAEDRAAGVPAAALATARADGRFEAEGWRVRKDGSRLWAHVTMELIRDDAGRAIGFAKITKDRTAQREAHAAALESERRFRHLVQGVTDYAIYMLDPRGVITNWNAGAERAKGYRAEEIVGAHFSRFFTPEDRAAGLPDRALVRALADGRFEAEGWRVRKDGTRFWAHVVLDAIHDDAGGLIGLAKITRDVTRQKADADRILEVTRTLDLALTNMKHGLCVFDGSETLRLANRRFLEVFGQDRTDGLIGLKFEEVVRQVVFSTPSGTLAADGSAEDFRDRHRTLIRAHADVSLVETLPGGRAVSIAHAAMPDGSWVSTFEDVTERTRADAIIAALAAQDALTGLANRRMFNERLASLVPPPADAPPATVLLIDLDAFKSINDTHGHAAGDTVLKHVADRLRDCLGRADLAARLGGDEFAVILHDCSDVQAAEVAGRLLADLRCPLAITPQAVTAIGLSVGVAQILAAHTAPGRVLADADLALYEAKAAGKGAVRVYAPAMRAKAQAERALEADLRGSLESGGGFALHYQPILDVATGRVSVREALLRWRHPHRGEVPPAVFIPVAEQCGLIGRLGAWVLRRACGDAAAWGAQTCVAINVSPFQLGGGAFPREVEEVLRETGLPPHRLEIEVTETALLDDGSDKLADLRRLHEIGVRVGLDDFGMGYASLAHLRAFPFDRIKIDGSFVRDAVDRPDCAVIVGIVAEMGRRLGMTVVAEGVETEAQLRLARDHGCHEVQGYLLGRPVPLDREAGAGIAA